MRKPLVLIAPGTRPRGAEFDDFSIDISQQYALAIHAAGGDPFIPPCLLDRNYIAEAVGRADGVLLTGGNDVQPSLYRKKVPSAQGRTVSRPEKERDLFEAILIEEVFRQKRPLLAICRGQQILNVALGGTLILDIPSQVPKALRHNRSDKKNDIVHEVKVLDGSVLAKIAGKPVLGVNSSHHQAVEKVAKPLRVTAVSIDGIIEGMELRQSCQHWLPYLVTVQFHPERLYARHKEHFELFRSFTDASRRSRQSSNKV